MQELQAGARMQDFKEKIRVSAFVLLTICISLAGLYNLLKPIANGCIMTYMYPTYVPISTPRNVSSTKYGMYLYHEGWRQIDFKEHIKQISGIPVLFIPGNGGSYKQVRSLAAESDRAYQAGPFEHTFYQEAFGVDGDLGYDIANIQLPQQYLSKLDWFAVDLEGEHSAMDARILEEHTEHVVYAIHRILDLYKESRDARVKDGAASYGSLPKSVILVGHSMGGFVARAAIVHPHLRKFAVETVLTLSTPHQSPPVALQPSLGHYYAHVNQQWRRGYEAQTSSSGQKLTNGLLSHVIVVSISGGYHDYQVRARMELLDGIVPPTHGFMISSTGMNNVWLSMEHQVSHTLLSLVDKTTGLPFADTRKRLVIFEKMLQSGIPPNFDWLKQSRLSQLSTHSGLTSHDRYACPRNIQWNDGGLERDLHIDGTTVTILAMDGRRRWLDLQKLGSNRKSHFVFVTNLAPCSGVRLHLWPDKGTFLSESPGNKRIREVTRKMVHIPSRPAPRQMEPGSQTEQAPPSAVFWLDPADMLGFRFLTISVAPRPSASGRPPPTASMGVGQFFNPREGVIELSPLLLISTTYSHKEMKVEEGHPLAFNMSFSLSLGLFPVTLSLKTTGCGIRSSEFLDKPGEEETSRLCKLRCFPPVALAWDATSGLHIFSNLHSETIIVDSSPALLNSPQVSEKTTVLLLVDPHCAYKASFGVSVNGAASRFLLLYFSKITGFSAAVVFFALMRQARAWELDLPIPSMLSAVESNLRIPFPFLFFASLPILFALGFYCLLSQPLPPLMSFIAISMLCYLFANGAIIMLISATQILFHVAATVHVYVKRRCQMSEQSFSPVIVRWFHKLSSGFFSLKVVRIITVNAGPFVALAAIILICFVHPGFGLFLLLLAHALGCHDAHYSFLMASFRSHTQSVEKLESVKEGENGSDHLIPKYDGEVNKILQQDENRSSSTELTKSYGETQLELFHHRHGLFILHLLAALMFVPSLVAWLQRTGSGQKFPWLLDSILCTSALLHGIFDSKPANNFNFTCPGFARLEVRLSFAYLLAGFISFLSGILLAPYKVFYPMAAIGVMCFVFRIIEKSRDKGQSYNHKRKHSHKH